MKQIYIIPTAGLCNRMRAMASGIFYAKRHNYPATIYWNNTKGLRANFCDLFQPVTIPGIHLIENKNWLYQIEFTRDYLLRWPLLHSFRKVIYNHSIYTNGDLSEKVTPHRENMLLISCCPMCECYSLQELFVPLPDLQKRIDSIVSQYDSNTIGIHIRRTDNLQSIKLSPIEAFINKMADEIKKDNNTTFYLASDDEEVKRILNQKCPNRIITCSDKPERDSLEGMRFAVVDLFCLSKTRKIIGSNYSSYSHIASELGGVELEYAQIDHIDNNNTY